jgi:Rap1a immunity proteins
MGRNLRSRDLASDTVSFDEIRAAIYTINAHSCVPKAPVLGCFRKHKFSTIYDYETARHANMLMLSGKLRKGGDMRSAILFAGCVLLASPASAEFDTGNDLYRFCTAPADDRFSSGICYGLISGYFDALHLAYKCEQETAKITRQQIKDLVMKALKDAPAKRHLPAFVLAGAAISDAFSCQSWVGNGPQK